MSFSTNTKVNTLKVTEQEYWQTYYDHQDKNYEWNNGYLEEKKVSDYYTGLMLDWFIALLKYYLRTYHNATYTPLEMGFHLTLPNKNVIRKPDFGVISASNPHQLKAKDCTYTGIFNLCVEALSDSNKEQITRDTQDKKKEYAQTGVQEYYILYDANRHTEFYQLEKGKYIPIKRKKGGIIQSKVLLGFQFRISDLYDRPDITKMIVDPVYKDFVLLDYQKQKNRANIAERKAKIERQKRKIAQQRVNEMEQKYKNKMLKFKVFCAKHNLEYR